MVHLVIPGAREGERGAALLKFRYSGPWTNAQFTRAAWKAVLCRPALLFSPALQKHRLVPGYFALTGFRRKILGRKARA